MFLYHVLTDMCRVITNYSYNDDMREDFLGYLHSFYYEPFYAICLFINSRISQISKRGRVSINFKWFNTKVYLVNSLFGEKLCRDFCPGSDAGVQLVIGY